MTPAELAVERDRLLEGGRTPEEVARMQWVVSPRAEDDLWGRLRTLALAWRTATEGRDPCGDLTAAERALRHAGKRLLSLPESASGASAPRPSGETP